MRRLFFTTCLLSLSSCATTSFAPPQVRMDHEIQANNNSGFFDAVCKPDEQALSKNAIDETAKGALRLINNFVLTYRCQRDRAAEGRQFFDVPGMLVGTGAATAAAFGAPAGVAIGAGAATVGLKQGKDYWDPKAKAVVFDDALDAMLCIQNEAVGIDPITLKALSDAEGPGQEPPPASDDKGGGQKPPPDIQGIVTQKLSNEIGDDIGITVTSEQQYFLMIRTALFSVERVVAQRLSDTGKPFDTAGVIAELEKYTKKAEKAETDAGTPETAGQNTRAAVSARATKGQPKGLLGAGLTPAEQMLVAMPVKQVGETVVKLKTLGPKLQQCVVRAKV